MKSIPDRGIFIDVTSLFELLMVLNMLFTLLSNATFVLLSDDLWNLNPNDKNNMSIMPPAINTNNQLNCIENWPFLSLWLIKIIAKYTDISVFIESARYCVLMQKWYAMQARADKHKTLLTSFLDYIPDMVWTKDTEHRFTYTNKPINDVLLLSDIIGDPVGSTSIDIATKLRDKGIRYTFGEICQDSDKIVIACEKSKTFLEYGTVGDSFLALRVIKAPIYDKGVLIGTIGIGRDVTWDWTQHEELEELLVAGRYEEALSLLQVHKRHDFAHT